MKIELLKMITAIMQSHDGEYVAKAIDILKRAWPGLTGVEKDGMCATIKTYSVMSIDDDYPTCNKPNDFVDTVLDDDYPTLVYVK